MPIQPPPRFVVRPADAPRSSRTRRHGLIAAWVGSLLVVAVLSGWLTGQGGHLELPVVGHRAHALRAQNEALKQQLANLRQARTVDQVSMRRLQGALSDRDEQINGLRADLAFYSHLVGGGAQRDGLRLQQVRLDAVPEAPRAWNLSLTLTRNARTGAEAQGQVEVSVEGIEKGKLTTLAWPQLAGAGQASDLGFSFKYFQQLHGTLMLPQGFTPNRLKVAVQPKRGDAVERTVTWTEALNKAGNDHVESGQEQQE